MTKTRGKAVLQTTGRRQGATPAAYEAPSHPDPFQILVAEHALLRHDLERARVAATTPTTMASADRQLQSFVTGFLLHTKREDRVVTPVCERLFGGKDGVAAVMREEHRSIREHLSSLMRGPPSQALRREQIERLRVRIEAHFAKEEHVLFPLMAALLSTPEAATLSRGLRRVSGA